MKPSLVLLIITVLWGTLRAENSLFFIEAQEVIGYSNRSDTPIWYSDNQKAEMQKPSLGFDFIHRFSNEYRDWATLAIQARMAYNQTGNPIWEPQLYNAYVKVKTQPVDVLAGHIRPAIGINSYLDGHALLVHNFTMHGLGYDRDWGLGLNRDFDWGNVYLTATNGSGMPIYFLDNYLLAGRIGYGVLNEDNYTVGFTAVSGEVLSTVGYHLMNHETSSMNMVGADLRYLWRNIELNFDYLHGTKEKTDIDALMWRTTLNFLEENKLKLDIQPVWVVSDQNWNYKLAAGLSYQVTPALTVRTLLEKDHDSNDQIAILQFYYYKNIFD